MIEQLTTIERQRALVLLLVVTLVGLILLIAGKDDPLGVHGALIMVVAIAAIFGVITDLFAPEPTENRLESYYDEPSKIGILLAMAWAAVGLFVGAWVAWQLAYPSLNFEAAWTSFGRLRPVHTTSVIFGFGGNALIATSFYVMQRTSRARIPDQISPLFVVFGYNLFCLLAVSGYMMGVTQSKEYAEPEWYADLWLVVVWVTYFVVYMRTLLRRKEPHIYVANWYYLAFVLVVAMLHIVNNLAVPISFGSAKSYTVFAGVQDAMTQWWYGHNAVAFFLTAGFLGMMYYFLPKRAGRPSVLLPPVDHQLLGHHLLLHVGGLAPPALHGPAAMGTDAGHDLLGDAARAVVGRRRQCAADAERRLAPRARRRDPALHDGRGAVLWADDLRRLVPRHPRRQFAVALHRLDRRPRPCRRAGLGGHDHLRLDLCRGAVAVEARRACIRRGWSRCISGSP